MIPPPPELWGTHFTPTRCMVCGEKECPCTAAGPFTTLAAAMGELQLAIGTKLLRAAAVVGFVVVDDPVVFALHIIDNGPPRWVGHLARFAAGWAGAEALLALARLAGAAIHAGTAGI